MRLPEFSNAQLDAAINAFQIICDDQRRAVLRHRESVDIRACAGSGKTTLLVAKLGLLSDWRDRFRGIAILSHTNVAHEEIRRRFNAMPRLRVLESYPHFLGTIQSFVNMALGIPGAVEWFGIRPATIDDEIFSRRALKVLQYPRYIIARTWLARQRNGDDLVRGLRFELSNNGEIALGSDAGAIPSPESQTGKALRRLKDVISGRGIFRYDDMDTFGLWYARRHPEVAKAIAWRFPVVFMDETQDTPVRQGKLLEYLFDDRSIVQRFGDDRQAIYRGSAESEEGVLFPRTGYLPMTSSLRFSPSIGKLVENVCIASVEPLSGNPQCQNHAHTVFLFQPAAIEKVLPAFAELVATELGPGLPPTRVMAVGFRRSGSGGPLRVPNVIGDYWRAGSKTCRPANATFDTLAEYVGAAQGDLRCRKTLADARTRLLHGACRLLELQGISNEGRPFNIPALLRALQEKDHRYAPMLLIAITRILKAIARGEAVDIQVAKTLILEGLRLFYGGAWNLEVEQFCSPTPLEQDSLHVPIQELNIAPSDGIFRHTTTAGIVQINVGTIHSVKGETLDAALVLTTFFYTHDLPQLLEAGLLCGRRPTAAQAARKRFQENVKRIYVAMTRPTRLLCLAMCTHHVSDSQRKEMEQLGWRFQIVSAE